MRRALAGLVLLLAVPTAAWSPSTAQDVASVERGRRLYEQSCVSCHGTGGTGTKNGPRLVDVGAAAADFYLSTGRMPMPYPGGQPERKPPAFDRAQIADLVAYVASLGGGPLVPTVDVSRADLVRGGELFRGNCAACHGYGGRGGALSDGRFAPSLQHSTPVQTVEAMRIGPGTMPAYSPDTLGTDAADAIAGYVDYLRDPVDRGGADLGYSGPIPEGLVVWMVGIVGLTLVAVWIGSTR